MVLRSVADRDAAYPELAGVVVEQESFCVVPLRIRGEGVGVLGLGWDDARAMDDEVVALARAVGELCAAALHRALAARDEVDARHRAEALLVRLGALQRVAAELSYATDVEAAARIVLASAMETLGAEAATFNLLDDDARVATLVASLGIDDSPIAEQTTWRVQRVAAGAGAAAHRAAGAAARPCRPARAVPRPRRQRRAASRPGPTCC